MTAAPYGYGMEPPFAQPRQTNTLGLVGFILALVGLCITGGLLSPVGLVLSLVAMTRPPRGFAVAGVVVGLVGTCGCSWLAFPLLAVAVGLMSFGAFLAYVSGAIGTFGGKEAVTGFHVGIIMFGLNAYMGEHGSLPQSLDELKIPAEATKDGWGGAFTYLRGEDGATFTLSAPGADGKGGTSDDISLNGVVGPGNQVTIKDARSTRSGKMTIRSTHSGDTATDGKDAEDDTAAPAGGAPSPG